MNCEMCGKAGDLFTAKVEGVAMNVCKGCTKFGNVIKRVGPTIKVRKKKVQSKPQEEEAKVVQRIVADYPTVLKSAREKAKLTQEEFAKKLNEKESTINKMESGHFKPGFALAKKLEKALHVKLIETFEDKGMDFGGKKEKGGGFTLGDFIKVKKK